jgi:putative DNA-invertase from lambdoid prophage Rac
MAIYGYCRVSTLKQANEGESLDVQRRQIEGYAHMHGLTCPIGGQLFAKLQRGDIVIAAKLDRLFRSALDALKVVESLRDRGAGCRTFQSRDRIVSARLAAVEARLAAADASLAVERAKKKKRLPHRTVHSIGHDQQ